MRKFTEYHIAICHKIIKKQKIPFLWDESGKKQTNVWIFVNLDDCSCVVFWSTCMNYFLWCKKNFSFSFTISREKGRREVKIMVNLTISILRYNFFIDPFPWNPIWCWCFSSYMLFLFGKNHISLVKFYDYSFVLTFFSLSLLPNLFAFAKKVKEGRKKNPNFSLRDLIILFYSGIFSVYFFISSACGVYINICMLALYFPHFHIITSSQQSSHRKIQVSSCTCMNIIGLFSVM